MELPKEIEWNIVKHMSHPVADKVRTNIRFKLKRYKTDSTHGCPFDRGSSDAYYYRDPNPHYWRNGNGRNGGTVYDLTPEQVEAYELGYFTQEDRR